MSEVQPKFSEFLRWLRNQRGLKVVELAEALDCKKATIYSYESGIRVPPSEKIDTLRETLCRTPEERAEFDLLRGLGKKPKPVPAPFTSKFGSDATTLVVGDITYPPFSGDDTCFINRFLQEMLNMAVVKIERPVHSLPASATDKLSNDFNMEERMNWIAEGKAHAIVNLQNPMRMRKLKFLPFPVRVSLNGVIMEKSDADIRAAQRQLVAGVPDPGTQPFQLIAIENEVGYVYLKEGRSVRREDLEIAYTLEAAELAKKLEPGRRRMLVCDEITALAVVAEKEGAAVLVLPPSTDESVIHVADRRKLPAHFLGLGMSREKNQQFNEYLPETVNNFLSTETEIVSEMIEKVYISLVDRIKESLSSQNFLYSGGIRRFSRHLSREDNKQPIGEEPGMARQDGDVRSSGPVDLKQTELHSWMVETVIDQNARAFARRCLCVTKRSVLTADELWLWRHVLLRAREKVLMIEAGNRAAVREIVVAAMKSVLGLDPAGSFDESYYECFRVVGRPEHWSNFKDLLERELDITLPLTLDPLRQREMRKVAREISAQDKAPVPESREGSSNAGEKAAVAAEKTSLDPDSKKNLDAADKDGMADEDPPTLASVGIYAFSKFEWFVSAVQRAMEANTEATRLVTVKEVGDRDDIVRTNDRERAFTSLWDMYSLERSDLPRPAKNSVRFVAYSMGQAVGFVTGVWNDFRKEHALEIQHVFVVEAMRKSGISRRLIRTLIDSVQITPNGSTERRECAYVWLPTGHRPEVSGAFERSGFTKSIEESSYFYRLFGLKEQRLSDPAGMLGRVPR